PAIRTSCRCRCRKVIWKGCWLRCRGDSSLRSIGAVWAGWRGEGFQHRWPDGLRQGRASFFVKFARGVTGPVFLLEIAVKELSAGVVELGFGGEEHRVDQVAVGDPELVIGGKREGADV